MTRFYLRVLGKPELITDEVPVDRLRTRRLWGVLVCLALSPDPVPRATLAETFWPDVDDQRTNLKVALSSLRTQFPGLLEESKSGLRLADGVACDAIELRERVRRAKYATDRQERRRLLEEAAERERGELLEGHEADWVLFQRRKLFTECQEFLEALMVLQREDGDITKAADTAVKLLRYQVDHAEATRLTLAHADPQELAERTTLEQLLKGLLSSWAPARLSRLQALAVFPIMFSEETAHAVTGISSKDLKEAVQNGIVLRQEGKLSLSAVAKTVFWEMLSEGQRRRLQRTHAQWIVDSVLIRSPDRLSPLFRTYLRQDWSAEYILDRSEIRQYVRDFEGDIHITCQYCAEYDDIENADIFFILICDYFSLENDRFYRYANLITMKWNILKKRSYYRDCMNMMAIFSLREKHLSKYFYELLESFLDTDYSIIPNEFQTATETALLFFHHSGEDAEFDRVLRQRLDLLRRFPEYSITPTTHLLIAENSLARKRFTYALLHNEQHFQHWQQRGDSNSLAAGLLQRGAIFKGLERTSEARSCWNEALVLNEEVNNIHGQASCLEALASIHRENFAFGEAQVLLREAIRLFQQSGDEAAVCAAEGSLGDVLRDREAFEEAERLYRQGLAFWQKRGHTRWVKRFEKRLTNLEERRGISIK